MEDGQDSDGVASVTDSEDEEQKAKEKFRAFVKQKGVLTLSFHTQSVVYYSYFVSGRKTGRPQNRGWVGEYKIMFCFMKQDFAYKKRGPGRPPKDIYSNWKPE